MSPSCSAPAASLKSLLTSIRWSRPSTKNSPAELPAVFTPGRPARTSAGTPHTGTFPNGAHGIPSGGAPPAEFLTNEPPHHGRIGISHFAQSIHQMDLV